MIKSNSPILQDEILASKIYIIRGTKVMLDRDLAELYGGENESSKSSSQASIKSIST